MRRNAAFVVGKGTRLVGILTDRDVLRRVVDKPDRWDDPVESVMTRAPDTLPPTATTGEALRKMEEGRYRNIPVINEHGIIQGNITYFAILKYLTDHFPQAVYNLPPDPENFAQQRDGG
jgi:CBS domain-containing protein